MAVAGISRARLDCVGDGVAEVQDLPDPGVALVLGDDPKLGSRTREDHRFTGGIRTGAHALPKVAARDQRCFDDLCVPGRALPLRQRRERVRVREHRRGLVIRADVVLRLGEVDPCLTAIGGIDLRH
jgi:hypothetical protein